MKSYIERLPEIDKAIFELGGKWPGYNDLEQWLYKFTYGKYVAGSSGKNKNPSPVCTYTEFEQRIADWWRLYEWGMTGISEMNRPSLTGFIKDQVSSGEYQIIAAASDFEWEGHKIENEDKTYEYMKKYKCTGEKPNLPDDCWLEFSNTSFAHKPNRLKVGAVLWEEIKGYSFRIVDDRYKPKEPRATHVNICGIRPCENKEDWERCGTDLSDFELCVEQTDGEITKVNVRDKRNEKDEIKGANEFGDWVKQLVDDKSDWFERGESPPSGTVCEFKTEALYEGTGNFALDWEECCVIYLSSEGAVVKDENGDDCFIDATDYKLWFRPLNAGRDEVIIEALRKSSCPDDEIHPRQYLINSLHSLYAEGMLKMPEGK